MAIVLGLLANNDWLAGKLQMFLTLEKRYHDTPRLF